MSLLPKVLVSKPKSSNYNLSRKSRFSAAPGCLYPVLIEDCVPGDKVKLNINSLLKTYPLSAPVMGSFKVQFDVFFAPWKNYVGSMHSNQSNFDPTTQSLPFFKLPVGSSALPVTLGSTGVPYGCLWDYLGIPGGFTCIFDSSSPGTYDSPTISALPWLAYWDIYRNYYVDPQQPRGAIMQSGAVSKTVDCENLATNFQQLLTLNPAIPLNDPSNSPLTSFSKLTPRWLEDGFDPVAYPDEFGDPLDFLALRTYQPDLNSAWLNSGTMSSMRSRVNVSTVDGDRFTIDQVRTANKLTKYLERTIVAGSRYDDYVRSNYGISSRRDLMYPEFLGSASSLLTFDDVVSTAESADLPLGTLAGRGLGILSSRDHIFTASDHGTLMVIMSIVPNVDYFQGIPPRMLKAHMTDVFAPALDNLGFQPRHASSLSVLMDTNNAGAVVPWTPSTNPFTTSVGEQPAWSEYMSAVNEIHGDFADSLRYWTLARPFTRSTPGPVKVTTYDTYVYPSDYNVSFADTSTTAQNFLVQCSFNLRMRRPISKQVMPTL